MRLIPDDALGIVTIFMEAEGEHFEGKVAVAEVIRNRMWAKYGSNGTVAGTVLRPSQFSAWNTEARNRVRSVSMDLASQASYDCVRAWHLAMNEHTNYAGGAVLYLNKAVVGELPKWAKPEHAKEVTKIGQHTFYVPLVK